MMMGDGNDTFATAEVLVDQGGFFEAGPQELDPPDTDVDFFQFTTSGPVVISASCKPQTDPFDPTYPDLVLSVYDDQEILIARNDDRYPRTSQDPELFTLLPAAGTYYIKVEEYCALFAGQCDPFYFDSVINLDYSFVIASLDPVADNVVAEGPEPNDTAATATAMEYASSSPGTYFASVGIGSFAGASDVDGYSFQVPADVALSPDQRSVVTFTVPPGGVDESGASTNPGVVEIVDPASSNVIARYDFTNEGVGVGRADFFAPIPAGQQRLFRVQRGGAVTGSAPFQFVIHTVGGGNPVETADLANDLFATAEVLPIYPGTSSYFIEGDLVGTDQDHFRIAVAGSSFNYTCVAERAGSGVRGLTVTVMQGSNGAILDTATESPAQNLFITGIDPGFENNLVILIEKSMQDPVVTGAYYRCGFQFI